MTALPAPTLAIAKRRAGFSPGWAGYAFASPWLLGFVVLTAIPMVISLLLSLVEWNGLNLSQMRWVGIENYSRAFADPKVGIALWNTFYYALLAVPLGLIVALFLAMLLNQQLAGMGIFRTLFYMPSVLGGVATIMVWIWIFQPEIGLLNSGLCAGWDALVWIGVASGDWQPPRWLQDPRWSKPALIFMNVWGAGGSMLIFLAALQNVAPQLYEAASIDGAGYWRKFWHVTLPQISPAIYFNLVIGVIGSLQTFNESYLMTAGGPNNSTLFFVLYLYTKAFSDFEFGYASALAWIIFGIILLMTLAVVRSSALWVYYEDEQR